MRISDWSSDVCSSDLHELALVVMAIAFAGELRQLVGLGIIFRLRCQPLRNAPLGGRRRRVQKRLRILGRRDTRRAVKDEGGTDIRLFQQHLGLQQFKLEADGPQVLAQQEIGVLKGEPRSEEQTSELQSL